MTTGGKMRSLIPAYVGLAAVVVAAYAACGQSEQEPPDVLVNPTPAVCAPYHTYLMFNYRDTGSQITLENIALSGKPDSEFPNEASDNAANTLKFVLYTADGHELGRHVVSLTQMGSDSPPGTATSQNNFSRQPFHPNAAYMMVYGPSGQQKTIIVDGTAYTQGLPLNVASCID